MRFPTPDGEFIALKNVDLQINKGEFVSLIGHSGCGKSTVLNLVAGLYMPTDGGVIVDGRGGRAGTRPRGGVPKPFIIALVNRVSKR